MKKVAVINKNVNVFKDGWHGHQYEFPPNQEVEIPLEAAIHIFGFNLKDKTKNLVRLGIANHKDGKNFLENFAIKAIEMVRADDLEELTELKLALEKSEEKCKQLEGELGKAKTEVERLTHELEKTAKKK